MNDIDAIIRRLKENEETVKKFHAVEAKILSILNFKDFFEVLLTEIEKTFNIPYVWISLIETSEISKLLRNLQLSEILVKRINLIEKSTFLELIGNNTQPVLENNDLMPYFKLIPQKTDYNINSIAIVPLSIDGEIIGSLNQADSSYSRFKPGIDTSLLEHLGIKVSLCLSNVAAHEKLKFLAYHDPLTGLLNRRVMETALKREFNRAKRYLCPLSVVFIDLDHFKRTNDKYGHEIGDKLLQYVADKLNDKSRESDIVARFAGDEFVLILPETKPDDAKKIMNRHKIYFLEHPLNMGDFSIPISISFGVASTEDKNIKNPAQLLKKADGNLYAIKKSKAKNINADTYADKKQNIITLPVSNKFKGKNGKNDTP